MTTLKTGTKIFVGGISNDIFESDLICYFEKYSKIEDCVIMVDKKTNHSRGFGFITVEDFYKADSILKNQPHIIKGKRMECKLAIPKDIINKNQQPEEHYKKKAVKDISFYYRKLFVGGLPMLMKESDIMKYFQRFGEVEKCIIKKDEISGKSRGFGFVIFVHKESIDVVLSYGTNHFVLGKWIEIKIATPKEKIFGSLGNSMLNITKNDHLMNNINKQQTQTAMNNRGYQNNNQNEGVNLNECYNSRQTFAYPNQNIYINSNVNNYDSVYDYDYDNDSEVYYDDSDYYLSSGDNFNDYATLPNIPLNNQSQNRTDLFQYENYIPKTQIAFFNNLNNNNSQGTSHTNVTTKTNNNQSMSSNDIISSTMPINHVLHQKMENMELHSLYQSAQNDKEKKKPTYQLNLNDNNNNDNSHNYLSNTLSTPLIAVNNIKNNLNTYYNCNNTINNNTYDNINTSQNDKNPSKENNKFTNYFNNCITHPYFNSYLHYKLFDSNGEEISKLVYKNSDKVTLFIDDKKRTEESIINNNPEKQMAETELELINKEQTSRSQAMTNKEINNQMINITNLISPNERDSDNQQRNGENRQETGFYSDKDISPDIKSFKPY